MEDADLAILKELGYVSGPTQEVTANAVSHIPETPPPQAKTKKEQCTGCKIRKGRTKCVLC